MNAQILGMGHAFPDNRLTNKDLELMVDTSDKWIKDRTGISERRIGGSEPTSHYGVKAAKMALANAAIDAKQLDLIIVATVTPDMIFPATACLVQEQLGAQQAAAFDLEAGCTGFIYALTVAEKFLLSPGCNYVLVIGADMLSRITDYSDRNTCVLFGDGAGAAVLGKGSGEYGIISSHLGADGSGRALLSLPAGGSAMPATIETIRNKQHFIKMSGNDVFRFASKIIVSTSETLLAEAGLGYGDIDCFIPHQANMRIIKTAMKRMQIPREKTVININQFGNMSAASIPVAMSMAAAQGKFQPKDLLLTVAFGAGLTFGGILFRWGRD